VDVAVDVAVDEAVDVAVDVAARELTVLLDARSFRNLPACLQAPTLAIRLVPVLFVQVKSTASSLERTSCRLPLSHPLRFAKKALLKTPPLQNHCLLGTKN
jgi:hypothetical protein